MNRIHKTRRTALALLSGVALLAGTTVLASDGEKPDEPRGRTLTFTANGEPVEVLIQDNRVRCLKNGRAVPQEQVVLRANTVTISDDRGARLAQVDLAPDVTRFEVVQEKKEFKIGVQLREVDEALGAQLDVEPDDALVIVDVTEGMPAKTAGVRRYDVLTKIQGEAPATRDRLKKELTEIQAGEQLVLTVIRKGETLDILVEPESSSDPTLTFNQGTIQLVPQISYTDQGLTLSTGIEYLKMPRKDLTLTMPDVVTRVDRSYVTVADSMVQDFLVRNQPIVASVVTPTEETKPSLESIEKEIQAMKEQLQRIEALLTKKNH